jgi:hypothetical protein
MGSRKWAKSGSVPDWIDVEAALRAVADIHLATTMVTILPVGTGATGGLRIAISSSWERLDGSLEPECVITERLVADHSNDSLPSIVMGGVYQHDYDIGIAYQQAKMGL